MKELKLLLIYIVLVVPTVLFGQGKIDRLVEEQFSFEVNSDDSPEVNSDDSPDRLGNKVAEDNKSKEDKKKFDSGLFYSTWGTGIQNTYTSKNGIDYVASLAVGDNSNKIEGLGTSIKSQTNFQTFTITPRYYVKDLGLDFDGFFGQAGLSFRSWSGSGKILDDRTKAKIGSVKLKWSPLVFVAGVGWKKVFDFMLTFSVSLNTSIGGSRTIEYTENMSKFNDSIKNDLESKTNYPTNLIIYFGFRY